MNWGDFLKIYRTTALVIYRFIVLVLYVTAKSDFFFLLDCFIVCNQSWTDVNVVLHQAAEEAIQWHAGWEGPMSSCVWPLRSLNAFTSDCFLLFIIVFNFRVIVKLSKINDIVFLHVVFLLTAHFTWGQFDVHFFLKGVSWMPKHKFLSFWEHIL